MGTRKISWG